MTTKTGFDEFCSSLINVHDNPPSTHVAEKLTALWVDEKDNTRKAILIDQLASLERNAWKCQAASAYRTQLRPVLECFFDQESFVSTFINWPSPLFQRPMTAYASTSMKLFDSFRFRDAESPRKASDSAQFA